MNKISQAVISAIAGASIMAAASCSQDNTLQYGISAIGNISGSSFKSDSGTILDIEEYACAEHLDDNDRAFIIYDVLNKSPHREAYGIRIRKAYKAIVKDPLHASALSGNEEMQREDPVKVTDIWISGGYVNMYVMLPVIPGSGTVHSVNLVLDDRDSGTAGYSFIIRHNASGETIGETGQERFVLQGGFISFPITGILTEDNIPVTFRWKWYKSAGDTGITSETEENILEGIFRKSRFGHAPASPSGKTISGTL